MVCLNFTWFILEQLDANEEKPLRKAWRNGATKSDYIKAESNVLCFK